MMKIGIVGLPNTGKSSLFNLLTHAKAKVDLYPFTTIDQNIGTVAVPDERLATLGRVLKPPKLTPASIEVIDIAGLVKGASTGEGLGNKFLGHIREVDLIVHVVRGFDDSSVPHVFATVDPGRDAEVVEAELAVADLVLVAGRLEKLVKGPTTDETEVLARLRSALESGTPPPRLNSRELELAKPLNLFCLKPVLYAFNLDAAGSSCPPHLPRENPFTFSARAEEEMADFPESDRREFRTTICVDEAGPPGIIERCFVRLGLIRFYTVKGDETRAWSVASGTKIADAAGKIHTDMREGFIKAEVTTVPDLVSTGGFHEAHNQGRVRIEGREYPVKDGDVVLIKFKA